MLPLPGDSLVSVGLNNGQILFLDANGDRGKQWRIAASRKPIISLGLLSQSYIVSLDKDSKISVWNSRARGKGEKMLSYELTLPTVEKLLTCDDFVVALPGRWEGEKKSVWRLHKTLLGIECLEDTWCFDAPQSTQAACSSANSFTLIAEDPNAQGFKKTIHTFTHKDDSAEEKLDSAAEAWITEKMSP
jgi:hypothetical protein